MASTFSPLLRAELPATGEQAGAWGATVNLVTGTVLETAIAGTASVVMSAGVDHTLTTVNNALDEARCAILNVSGTLTGNQNVICPSTSKSYIVYNGAAGAFTLTVKTAAGTGVVIPPATALQVYCNGTNVALVTDIGAQINAAANKAVPIGADKFALWDSVAGALKTTTLAQLLSTVPVYVLPAYVSRTVAFQQHLFFDGL